MELIQQLAQGLNIQEEQAQGGAGLLFKMAQEKLGDNDFAQVANVVPGISGLIGAAPAAGGGGRLAGALGGLAGAMGGGGGAMGNVATMAAVAGGFSKLGLNPGMATKFVPIILSFVQNKGGDGVMNILAGALK